MLDQKLIAKTLALPACSGRSLEAAEVIFQNKEDAIAAVKQYNNLALDNKPMKIELIESSSGSSGRMLSSGLRSDIQPSSLTKL